MKPIKRTLSLLMVPAMLLGLAACAKAPSQQPTEAQTVATEPETTVSATDSLFENMTLEEKVGQLFYMCYPDANYADTIKQYHLGGLVLFGAHFEDKTADDIRQQIQAYQRSAEKVALLIGVDEEGGDVVRVSSNPNVRSEAFWSPKETYQNGGWDAVTAAETEKAERTASGHRRITEVIIVEQLGNLDMFRLASLLIHDVPTCRLIVAVDVQYVLCTISTNLKTLLSQVFLQKVGKLCVCSINKEHLCTTLGRTLVVENPQIGGDVSAIEQILGQSHNAVEQVAVK